MSYPHEVPPALLLALTGFAASTESALKFADPKPQAYSLTLRASEIDPRCKSHPEVGFVLEAAGKPADAQRATVDTRVAPRGQLVIWLMGHSQPLAEKVNSYGLHYIKSPMRVSGSPNSTLSRSMTRSTSVTSASKPPPAGMRPRLSTSPYPTACRNARINS